MEKPEAGEVSTVQIRVLRGSSNVFIHIYIGKSLRVTMWLKGSPGGFVLKLVSKAMFLHGFLLERSGTDGFCT